MGIGNLSQNCGASPDILRPIRSAAKL